MKSTIQLTKLRLDGGTQPRVRIDMDVVRDYAERIKAGDDFPPVDVFHDGAEHWLAEGFHRYHAYKEAGHKVVPCTLRKGTVRDAILFSCGANGAHGLRRSRDDKRKAVHTLLADEEWVKYSDRKIADICCVGADMVGDARRQLSLNDSPAKATRIGKDGRSRPAAQPSKPEKATTSATVSYPFTCPNCGGHSQDDDGDCGKCCEPAEPPKPVKPETNDIGRAKASIDSLVAELIEGQKPHFAIAIADHLTEVVVPRLLKAK